MSSTPSALLHTVSDSVLAAEGREPLFLLSARSRAVLDAAGKEVNENRHVSKVFTSLDEKSSSTETSQENPSLDWPEEA